MARWRAEEESVLHPANWDNSIIKSNIVRLVCYIYIYTHNIYIYVIRWRSCQVPFDRKTPCCACGSGKRGSSKIDR
jgi:hypothetical protein